jgi:hypothetical protein
MNVVRRDSSILRPLAALSLFLAFIVFTSCSPAESKTTASPVKIADLEQPKGPTIDIEPGGPADTVRAFYNHLRAKKFREAVFLTNMRPAIEGLTDAELKDFELDFEAISGQVPADVEINGEIVSGDKATVTVNLPKAPGEKSETQTLDLRRENGVWVLLTIDPDGEKRMKADGKKYFYNLRIESHHDEAHAMLNRIAKAQLVYSSQNQGAYADLRALVGQGLVPDDVNSSTTTGYNYAVILSDDKRSFSATATPAEYGRSGRLSFLLDKAGITSKDNGGKPLKNQ